MSWLSANDVSPEVATAMRKAGVVSVHAMGLRAGLEPEPKEHNQMVLLGLQEIERSFDRNKAAGTT